jgi:VIT1/CCC1 family predicted Fe2+/Mn2+ transporter
MWLVNEILGVALLFLSYLTMTARYEFLPRSEAYSLLFLAVGAVFLALGIGESLKRIRSAGKE